MRKFDANTASDLTLVALRVAVGAILVWGASTKLLDPARFAEIVDLWRQADLPAPHFLASLSVGGQLALGALLLVGLFTRFAGLANALNFALAVTLTGVLASSNLAWAFVMLVALMLHLGLAGGGRWSIDTMRERRLAAARAGREDSIEAMMASLGVRPGPGDRNNPGDR